MNRDNVPHFEFATIGAGGRDQGWQKGELDQFRGAPSHFVVREAIQNIIDAKADPKDPSPVVAKFSVKPLKIRDLPGFEELKEWVKDASRLKTNKDVPRSVNFYSKAIHILEGNGYINILQVFDSNTKGLTGTDEVDSEDYYKGDYYKFFNPGITGKRVGAGGSYGIGKKAFYAASQLQLIYVSSAFGDNQFMFKGSIELNTIKRVIDGTEIKYQDTGSYGMRNQTAIRDFGLIPDYFQRKEKGTSIYIVSFIDGGSNWKELMVKSVLQNFWPAIHDGKLEVKIDDINIDNSTLGLRMKEHFNQANNDTDDNSNPLLFYKAYTESSPIIESSSVLGNMKLYTVKGENYNSRIAYMRSSGMIIYRNTRFRSFEHMSVLKCDDDDGNELLRNIEDSTHSKWKEENVDENNPELKQKAKIALKDITEFLRKNLTYDVVKNKNETLDIRGLDDLSFPIGSQHKYDDNSDIGDEETFGGFETGFEIGAVQNDTRLVKHIKPVKVKPILPPPPLPPKNMKTEEVKYRTFSINENGETIHIVKFHGSSAPGIRLYFFGVTDDGLKKVNINRAEHKGNRINTESNCVIYSDEDRIKSGDELKILFEESNKYCLIIHAYVKI